MAKKTKADLEGDVVLLEIACGVYVKELGELKEQIVKFEKLKLASQTSHANLVTDKINLTKDLKNAQGKVKFFYEMLKQEQEQTRSLEDKLLDANRESFAMQEDILVQFGAIKTMVENAETLLLTE